MSVDTRGIVAKNLQALFRAARRGGINGPATTLELQEQMRATTGKRETSIDRRTVDRALDGAHGCSIDTLAVIAEAFEVEPWHLLVPGMQPDAPPVLLADDDIARDAAVAREIQRRTRALVQKLGETLNGGEARPAKSTTRTRRRKVKP